MTLQILQSSIKKAKKNKDKTKIEFFQKLEVVDLQLAKDKKRGLIPTEQMSVVWSLQKRRHITTRSKIKTTVTEKKKSWS